MRTGGQRSEAPRGELDSPLEVSPLRVRFEQGNDETGHYLNIGILICVFLAKAIASA